MLRFLARATASQPALARGIRARTLTRVASTGVPKAEWTGNLSKEPREQDVFSHGSIEDEILLEADQDVRTIWLNRPKALNALTIPMLETMSFWVSQYDSNPAIRMVFLRGRGPKAFCAGGDIKQLWRDGQKPETRDRAVDFFAKEYYLNYTLATSNKAFVGCLDGITMGGGVGIGAHCKHVVATERTVFAMPETGIGLFPDVGASHLLSRLPDGMGFYLGLTGQRLEGEQLMFAGIATHLMHSDALHEAPSILAEETSDHSDRATAVALDLMTDGFVPSEDDFHMNEMQWIRYCFGAYNGRRPAADLTLPAMIERLRELASLEIDGDSPDNRQRCKAWASTTLDAVERASPLSLSITHEQLTRAASLGWEDCFRMEFRMAQRCMQDSDFFEGVRALLIDRCGRPAWKYASVAEVAASHVASFFEDAPGDRALELPQGRGPRPDAHLPRSVMAHYFRPLSTGEYAHFARRSADAKLPMPMEHPSRAEHRLPWEFVMQLTSQEVRGMGRAGVFVGTGDEEEGAELGEVSEAGARVAGMGGPTGAAAAAMEGSEEDEEYGEGEGGEEDTDEMEMYEVGADGKRVEEK